MKKVLLGLVAAEIGYYGYKLYKQVKEKQQEWDTLTAKEALFEVIGEKAESALESLEKLEGKFDALDERVQAWFESPQSDIVCGAIDTAIAAVSAKDK